ncbi:37S ribosomal protein S11, putative [Talaromyces stipitatus ATCC 10500]|uniref:37S ribosomal protein S11, putative n=1 Tax=Talaromyces stipitatus (strain ATCC 10500 / CBS 375.48 / QM 6759 / NRRL 1006) TaxID=441959 RepID=B8LUU5_TALSN|nr:37S ribosomal protein S11, putative [Talaromyces stipitatus ATCC 10500]EED24037.1 37S ribosomal protein S11, putative [Talaromyces stipitatus ATCC 10500]
MRARLWNTFEQTVPWIARGSRQPLSQVEGLARFSTASRSYAPLDSTRDSAVRRQRENDILRSSKPVVETSSNDSQGLEGVLRVLSAKNQAAGQKNATYIDGVRARQEQLYSTYGNRTPPYNLHVYAHKHNTIITLTRPNGNPLMSLGCGNIGFRKSHRSGYDPAYQLSSHVFAQIQEKGLLPEITGISLVFRGFGMGRDAFIKVLLGNEGRNVRPLVTRVTDSTRIKFGDWVKKMLWIFFLRKLSMQLLYKYGLWFE